MRKLASIAPSFNVRDFLLSLIDEMDEELPEFTFADQSFLETSSWDFDDKQNASIQQCKSLWKKCRKFAREVKEVFVCVVLILKAADDIIQYYDKWNAQEN
jgi:hypothetical protein